jgi:hypothetical protein
VGADIFDAVFPIGILNGVGLAVVAAVHARCDIVRRSFKKRFRCHNTGVEICPNGRKHDRVESGKSVSSYYNGVQDTEELTTDAAERS